MTITWRTKLLALTIAWLLFAAISATGSPIAMLGAPLLLVLPGWLLLHIFNLPVKTAVHTFIYSVGLSLVALIAWGLACNVVLPQFGLAHPLTYLPLTITTSILLLGLLLWAYAATRERQPAAYRWQRFTTFEFTLAAAPLFLVVLATAGAVLLNNGGSGVVTFIMLLGAVAYAAALMFARGRVRPGVVAWGLYWLALTLLLMTSLRGWFTTGHDIEQEMFVFRLTEHAGVWSMQAYQNAYNACMSITILPTQLAGLLHVPDTYVFKVLFPLIFAVCPVIIYSLVTRLIGGFIALTSALYFMAAPTFFLDMPMLNRQIIAFVLLATLVHALCNAHFTRNTRRWVAVIFGLAMVVSHYSTTYLVVAILAAALVLRWIITWLAARQWRWRKRVFARSAIVELRTGERRRSYALNAGIVIILALATVVWSLMTWVSNPTHLATSAWNKTVKCAQGRCSLPSRSSDVGLTLFGASGMDYATLMAKYRNNVIDPMYANIPAKERYKHPAVPASQMPVQQPEQSPPTNIARDINSALPFNIIGLSNVFHDTMVRLVQLLMIIGAAAMLWFYRRGKAIATEYAVLALVSLLVVVLTVAVPGLSVRYGVMRAFEQSLLVAAPLIAIGTMTIFAWAKLRVQYIAVGVVALLFMLATTGILDFALGGTTPDLHLANSGTYYRLYYTHQTEVTAMNWLSNRLGNDQNTIVQLDGTDYAKWRAQTLRPGLDQIYPDLVRKDSYVFLGTTNVTTQTSTVSYQGTFLTYRYPFSFLDQQKNLIYSSGGARIYR